MMTLGVTKRNFFQKTPNLGEPPSLISETFLTLDSTAYLQDLSATGNLFYQFTDEAQRFDYRYALEFDAQYAYASIGNVSGKITNFPAGASPYDYVVDVFVYTDQAYFIESVPVGANWDFTTIAGTNKGNKIAHLVAVENVVTVGGGGEVTSYGTVLAETYVVNPQEGRRFPRSYNVDPNHSAFEQLRYRSFGYDVAATIVAMISMGEEEYAAEYCLAMLKTQQRQQLDDGGIATGQGNTDRMPFSSFLHNPQLLIDAYHRTGAEFWQAGAMLHFALKYPASSFLTVADLLTRTNDFMRALYNQEYVISAGLQNGLFRGGKGGYITDLDTENNQLVYLGFDPNFSVGWVANEHTVDAYFTLKAASENASFPDLWNAQKRSSANAWRSFGIDKARTGNMLIQFQVKDLTHTVMMAISETAAATTLNDATASALGVSIIVDASGNIFYQENSGGSVDTTINAAVGDVLTLEYEDATDDYKLYQNGTLIYTSTYTNANAQQIHFGSFHLGSELHKLQYAPVLLSAYAYDRTYPITSWSAIHADYTDDITADLLASVQAGLQSTSIFYNSGEARGRRGVSQDIYNGITGLTKDVVGAGYNAGGVSVARMATGELHDFSYEVDNLTTSKIAGFSFDNAGQGYTDIDFGWFLDNGFASVVENGTSRTTPEAVTVGQRLSMVIDTSNKVRYYIDGVLKFTSAATPTFSLLVDCSIYNDGAAITKCILDNAYMPWETGASLVDCTEITEVLSGLLDDCHALDNLTWYAIARYAMGDTTEPDACVDYVINGDDGSYSTYDGFYSAIGLVPYIPNNGCYQTPLTQALMWTEGGAGYVMALKAKGDDATAKTQLKEIAKISRIDGIPYVTQKDNIYELQDWGCIIASAWTQIANKPNGWWDLDYAQILTGDGL